MGNSIPPLKNNNSDGLQVFVEINPPLPHARISCIDIVNNIPLKFHACTHGQKEVIRGLQQINYDQNPDFSSS